MRRLYSPPPGAPRMVQATRSRMDETPATEGDIPAYFRWDDGSEYDVFEEVPGGYRRRFHGPMFGLQPGEWKQETWSDSTSFKAV